MNTTLYVHLFPDTLEAIFFGGVSPEEMVELETVRYLQGIDKSLLYALYNKNTHGTLLPGKSYYYSLHCC